MLKIIRITVILFSILVKIKITSDNLNLHKILLFFTNKVFIPDNILD